jgi:hypothetical protein
MPSVVMLSPIMLNVTYKPYMQCVFMLSVVKLSVVKLSVVAPYKLFPAVITVSL